MPVNLPSQTEFERSRFTKLWSCKVQIRGQTVPLGGISDVEDEREDLLFILRLAERRLKSIARKAAKDVARYQYQADHLAPHKLANEMELASLGYHHHLGELTLYFYVPERIFGGHDVEIDLGADQSLGPAGLTG
ncbi:hypothetical protein [Mariniblastus fucicola]|uniref:Uncharacterized protein n=1 Tax=Mariniblastus fucicola TaxID=980251 RepID=A0A5B9PJM7_9BACT|nr:hypothetical protein [Mariniblastus fucicola]QEG22713.1 hypothetical protein MFFC18_25960 [Mariniblastus fucicola]